MIEELMDEALVFAGRERGWRPTQGEILLGADLLEESHALGEWAPALYAEIVEAVTSADTDKTRVELSSNQHAAVLERDRLALERAAQQVMAAFVRLVVVNDDRSFVEFQEFWRGPLRRFVRAAGEPECVAGGHQFDLDLAYVPERYNTQQHLAAWEAYEEYFERRLVLGAELLGVLRRGESAENFDFVGHGIHWSGREVPFSRSVGAVLDLGDPDGSVGRIDRCLNGCGAALVEFDGDISYFMPV